MGREVECRARFDGQRATGTALLETSELRFRGAFRLKIPFQDIRLVDVEADDLVVVFSGGTARFELGEQAAVWAERIRSPKRVIDKLGVRQGMRVAVLGIDDPDFEADLAARTQDITRGRRGKPHDLVFLGAARPTELSGLAALRDAIRPEGGIWVVWPKGRPGLREDQVRAAARRAGLVDVKVVSFSTTHSALKLVIPVAKRR